MGAGHPLGSLEKCLYSSLGINAPVASPRLRTGFASRSPPDDDSRHQSSTSQSPNTQRVMRELLWYPPFLANGSSFQNLSAAARAGSSSSSEVPMSSARSAERIGPRKMKLSPYDAKYDSCACRCSRKNSGEPVLGPVRRDCLIPLRREVD